jgi:hypothetical protein
MGLMLGVVCFAPREDRPTPTAEQGWRQALSLALAVSLVANVLLFLCLLAVGSSHHAQEERLRLYEQVMASEDSDRQLEEAHRQLEEVRKWLEPHGPAPQAKPGRGP